MERIVTYFRSRKSFPVYLLMGVLVSFFYIKDQRVITLWLSHIFMLIYCMPFVYQLTGSFNHTLCCHLAEKCKKNKFICGKVRLRNSCKNFFCGYGTHSEMQWMVFIVQCILLLYIGVFVLLNFGFVGTILVGTADLTKWSKVWLFEIVVQFGCVGFAMVCSYIKTIFLLVSERKSNNKLHNESLIKSNIKIRKNMRIIRQRKELAGKLKKYGLYVDAHKYYIINEADMEEVEKLLISEIGNLYTELTQNARGTRVFNIYRKKDNYLMLSAYVKNK